MTESLYCQKCSTQSTRATLYCELCQLTLCNECSASIHAIGTVQQRSHIVIPISTITNQHENVYASGKCNNCQVLPASIQCNSCINTLQMLCTSCDAYVHRMQSKKDHMRISTNHKHQQHVDASSTTLTNDSTTTASTTISLASAQTMNVCSNCDVKQSEMDCEQCLKSFCQSCDQRIHRMKRLQMHKRTSRINSKPSQSPSSSSSVLNIVIDDKLQQHQRAQSASPSSGRELRIHSPLQTARNLSRRSFSGVPSTAIGLQSSSSSSSSLLCCNCGIHTISIECADCGGVKYCEMCDDKLHKIIRFKHHIRKSIKNQLNNSTTTITTINNSNDESTTTRESKLFNIPQNASKEGVDKEIMKGSSIGDYYLASKLTTIIEYIEEQKKHINVQTNNMNCDSSKLTDHIHKLEMENVKLKMEQEKLVLIHENEILKSQLQQSQQSANQISIHTMKDLIKTKEKTKRRQRMRNVMKCSRRMKCKSLDDHRIRVEFDIIDYVLHKLRLDHVQQQTRKENEHCVYTFLPSSHHLKR